MIFSEKRMENKHLNAHVSICVLQFAFSLLLQFEKSFEDIQQK